MQNSEVNRLVLCIHKNASSIKKPRRLVEAFHIWFLAANSCQRPHPVFLFF